MFPPTDVEAGCEEPFELHSYESIQYNPYGYDELNHQRPSRTIQTYAH